MNQEEMRKTILEETAMLKEVDDWAWIFSAFENSKNKDLKSLVREIRAFVPQRGRNYSEKCEMLNAVLGFSAMHDEWYYVCDDKNKRSAELAFVLKDVDGRGTAACLSLKRVGSARTLTIAYGAYQKLTKSIKGAVKIAGQHKTTPFDAAVKMKITANSYCSITDYTNEKKYGFFLVKSKDGKSGKVKGLTPLQFDEQKTKKITTPTKTK